MHDLLSESFGVLPPRIPRYTLARWGPACTSSLTTSALPVGLGGPSDMVVDGVGFTATIILFVFYLSLSWSFSALIWIEYFYGYITYFLLTFN